MKVNTCEAFRYHWLFWKWLGLIPPEKHSKWRFPYFLYSFFLTTTATLGVYPVGVILSSFFASDLNEFYNSIFTAITSFGHMLKFVSVYLKLNQLLKFHPIIKKLDDHSESLPETQILNEAIKSAHFWIWLYFRAFFFTINISELVVIFSSEQINIFPVYLPWDTKKYFILTNIFELFSLYVISATQACNDSYMQAYIRVLTAHIRALSIRISRLGFLEHQQCSDFHTRYEKTVYDNLKKCIKDHKHILKLLSILSDGISNTILVQFICTGISQCTIGAFLIFKNDIDKIQLLSVLLIFADVTIEMFMICYFCEMVYTESENLTLAIYKSNWCDQSNRYRKTLLFFLHRSQKTNIITASKLIPVNLQTFLKVMKITYSMFTVLSGSK